MRLPRLPDHPRLDLNVVDVDEPRPKSDPEVLPDAGHRGDHVRRDALYKNAGVRRATPNRDVAVVVPEVDEVILRRNDRARRDRSDVARRLGRRDRSWRDAERTCAGGIVDANLRTSTCQNRRARLDDRAGRRPELVSDHRGKGLLVGDPLDFGRAGENGEARRIEGSPGEKLARIVQRDHRVPDAEDVGDGVGVDVGPDVGDSELRRVGLEDVAFLGSCPDKSRIDC